MAGEKTVFAGEVTQIAGTIAIAAGLLLSLRHWPIALALAGGAMAFYAGKRLRGR